MSDKFTNTHYILLDELLQKDGETDDAFKQRKIRFKLWISELNRIGIRELIVPRNKIADVLERISKKSKQKTVFVTGSHEIDSKAEEYARELGKELAAIDGLILNSGQSSGIGDATLSAFMKYIVDNKQEINSRVHIFPNPYAISPDYAHNPALIPNLKKERMPIIASSTLVIVFPGNIGTTAEIELARAKSLPVIPVIWEKEHYKSLAISHLLNDDKNMRLIEESSCDYYKSLKDQDIPEKSVVLDAIRSMINEKV